jgi:tetratricopeptide (TPR) repeat protein
VTLRSVVDGLPELEDALAVDLQGRIIEATPAEPQASRDGASAAAVVSHVVAAGASAGFTRLALLEVRAPRRTTVTAVRPDALVVAKVDTARGTRQVVKALQAWAPAGEVPPPPLALRCGSGAVAAPQPAAPRPAAGASSRPAPPAAPQRPPPVPAVALAPAPAAPGPDPRALEDPWAGLRRALVRGQLTEAAARHREIAGAAPRTDGRPGAEPLARPALQRAMQLLLDGIGSVMAGDAVGGGRTLLALTGAQQQNLSVRWLAHHWCARAATRSGGFGAAGAHVKEALAIARQLDIEARAVSQLAAAEVLAHDADPGKALAWLRESRSRFERLQDRWGTAQTWLVEARVLARARRDEEAAGAAQQAWAADPGSDEPPIFLARRALVANDLARAEELLLRVETPAAERVRSLVQAIRDGAVSAADAGELLRVSEGVPGPEALRALERIAGSSPRFVQAREALARILLRLGKYAEARTLFRGLLAEPLGAADRASVMLGLGCIANALPEGKGAEATLRSAGGREAPAQDSGPTTPALPRLSSSVLLGGSGGPSAVFSGLLGDFAVPDLLEFLRSARRTGLLVCSSAANMGTLRFRDGFVTAGAAPGTPDLGAALVRLRKVSALALAALASPAGAEQPDHVLGEALVREGIVDAAAVHEAQRLQIELTIRQLVQWKDGEFAFSRDAEDPGPRAGGSVSLDPQAVLLEVFRQLDEESRGAAASA